MEYDPFSLAFIAQDPSLLMSWFLSQTSPQSHTGLGLFLRNFDLWPFVHLWPSAWIRDLLSCLCDCSYLVTHLRLCPARFSTNLPYNTLYQSFTSVPPQTLNPACEGSNVWIHSFHLFFFSFSAFNSPFPFKRYPLPLTFPLLLIIPLFIKMSRH